MEGAGIEFDDKLVVHGDFRYESGLAAAAKMLDLPDPPTAIFAASDVQAMGVYEPARQRQLRLPDELSVVGFDDVPMAEWMAPPLTTVPQPLEKMAALAVRTLLSGNTANFNQRAELATNLVVRAGTAARDGRTSAELHTEAGDAGLPQPAVLDPHLVGPASAPSVSKREPSTSSTGVSGSRASASWPDSSGNRCTAKRTPLSLRSAAMRSSGVIPPTRTTLGRKTATAPLAANSANRCRVWRFSPQAIGNPVASASRR